MTLRKCQTILGLGLLSAIVTTAVIAVPASAAGSPHWYVDGIKAPEGEVFPSISWGTLNLSSDPDALPPPLLCENASIGHYENPTDGGAGEGATETFTTIRPARNQRRQGGRGLLHRAHQHRGDAAADVHGQL